MLLILEPSCTARDELVARATARRQRLREALLLQQFLRDVSEVRSWAREALQTVIPLHSCSSLLTCTIQQSV